MALVEINIIVNTNLDKKVILEDIRDTVIELLNTDNGSEYIQLIKIAISDSTKMKLNHETN